MIQLTIRSGAQTGVDRAALDVAIELALPTMGWVPLGRLAEDGPVSDRYPGLIETPSADYAQRTEWNVRDAGATLVLHAGPPSGGTAFTIETARRLGKPRLILDLAERDDQAAAREIGEWLAVLVRPLDLNVAGPRASQWPDGYRRARAVLLLALGPTE